MLNYQNLSQADPEIMAVVRREMARQSEELEMIASENYVSPAVLEAMATVLTNKYSEGYPGHRYYGGNQIIDEAESLAATRAKKLFGAEHVNVQPLSGSPANAAVPGEKIVRRRTCQCPALVRFAGQRGGLFRVFETRRQSFGFET